MAVLMIGTIGSNFFRAYKGSVKECREWQKKINQTGQVEEKFYQRIISNKRAKYLKWSDCGIYGNPKRFTYVFDRDEDGNVDFPRYE